MSDQLLDTPSRHSLSVTGLLDDAWNKAREGAFYIAKGPLARVAEAAVVTVLKNIKLGQLSITTTAGRTYVFGPSPSSSDDPALEHKRNCNRAELRVLDDVFWIRLCCMGDLGFSEAFMFGEVECLDLIATFKIFLFNRPYLQTLENSRLASLLSIPQRILNSSRFLNSLGNSQSNISAHYDISNAMFAGFLSEDMTYSCAIFKQLDEDLIKSSIELKESTEAIHQPPTILDSPPLLSKTVVQNEHGNELKGRRDRVGDVVDDELHAAQLRKLDHIIARAQIKPGMRVLEIGSGWGSLALRIVSTIPGTKVDTITLSVHQQALARERIRKHSASHGFQSDDARSYENRIEVHLMDYRAMPREWEGAFDRVVSVEMLEAVGIEFLDEYWRVVDWALKKGVGTDAVGVVQCITIPEARFQKYASEVDFIRKWSKCKEKKNSSFHLTHTFLVFPGGILPTLTHILASLSTGSKGALTVDSVSNIGPHYARTLREWRRTFEDRFDEVIEPALRAEYPAVMGEGSGARGKREVDVFRRKWIYYYCYCEIGFTTRSLGDHIITFTREGNEAFGCTVYD